VPGAHDPLVSVEYYNENIIEKFRKFGKFRKFSLENFGSLRTSLVVSVHLRESSEIFGCLRESSEIFRKDRESSESSRKHLDILNKISLPFFEPFLFLSG